jgi:hypothetical protein
METRSLENTVTILSIGKSEGRFIGCEREVSTICNTGGGATMRTPSEMHSVLDNISVSNVDLRNRINKIEREEGIEPEAGADPENLTRLESETDQDEQFIQDTLAFSGKDYSKKLEAAERQRLKGLSPEEEREAKADDAFVDEVLEISKKNKIGGGK